MPQLYYKSGKVNVEADALSQIRHENYTQITSEVVKAITSAAQFSDLTDFVPESETVIAYSAMAATQRMMNAQWEKEQLADEVLSQVIRAVEKKLKSSDFKNEDVRCLLRHRNWLVLRNQLLYWKYMDSTTGR